MQTSSLPPNSLQPKKKLSLPKEVRINATELNQRLVQELRGEERYKLINDAKLRAMTQGTTTYEDFRY